MEVKEVLAGIEVDTIYGRIKKVSQCFLMPIDNKENLKLQLKRTFIKLEEDILKEFETLKKFNNKKVDNEQGQ